ncbi:Hsp70 protein-domain-containing protein [Lentinula lateritia]|nr:Hsp70 protein-domain-containing protein [Lentinula lateritia]
MLLTRPTGPGRSVWEGEEAEEEMDEQRNRQTANKGSILLLMEFLIELLQLGSQLLQSSLDRFYRGPELSPIVSPIHHAIDDSGLNLDEIEVVELIGGSSRIPAVRARIAECFPGKTLSTTLNQDGAVARGATFSCAMLSPVFRVREFSVSDMDAYPIKVQWAPVPSDPEEDTELVVFGEGNAMPSTKILSFYRKDPFDIEAVYAKPGNLPGGINPWIAKFTAKEVPLLGQENPVDAVQVKLKTRLNANDKDEPAPMDGVEGGEAAAAPPKKKKIIL